MDRKTIIGLVLIMGLLIGYSVWMSPSKEELAQKKRIQDSLALIQEEIPIDTVSFNDSVNKEETDITAPSANNATNTTFENLQSQYGAFVTAAQVPENTDP
ncbi:MAG: hypothetical protein WCQ79_07910, partial [Bacteroidales bacterium]